MADTSKSPTTPAADADIEAQMARIDGVNGAAGHHLDDPYLRSLVKRQLAGEITGDEARELGRRHLTRQNPEHEQTR